MPQPVSFQINWNTIIHLNADGSDSTFQIGKPPSRRKWLTTPVPPRISWNSATTITHERKCGR